MAFTYSIDFFWAYKKHFFKFCAHVYMKTHTYYDTQWNKKKKIVHNHKYMYV